MHLKLISEPQDIFGLRAVYRNNIDHILATILLLMYTIYLSVVDIFSVIVTDYLFCNCIFKDLN